MSGQNGLNTAIKQTQQRQQTWASEKIVHFRVINNKQLSIVVGQAAKWLRFQGGDCHLNSQLLYWKCVNRWSVDSDSLCDEFSAFDRSTTSPEPHTHNLL